MIFYFSGTGNSRWIAYRLAEELREKLVFIPDALRLSGGSPEADPRTVEKSPGRTLPEFTPRPGENIGFVFPVYSWGPPAIVLEFIRKLNLSSYTDQYTFFVCSCGDETGLTPNRMHQALSRKGWKCHAGFSVCMPNNYVLFPGFDVDPQEVEKRKLADAEPRMREIICRIKNREETTDCHIGSLPRLKSRVIFPLFNRFAVSARPYRSTDVCNGCGKCVRHCPTRNISLSPDKRPVWGDRCAMCVACYHICPHHAIAYGNKTRGKGTYFHPDAR